MLRDKKKKKHIAPNLELQICIAIKIFTALFVKVADARCA